MSVTVNIFPVELWLSWAAAYSITRSVFPYPSVFLLMLSLFFFFAPWPLSFSSSHSFNCSSHIYQLLAAPISPPPHHSDFFSSQTITELSGHFHTLLLSVFPTVIVAEIPTTAATSSCAPTPLRECVWSSPTIDRYIVPDRLDRATSQQTRDGGVESGGF